VYCLSVQREEEKMSVNGIGPTGLLPRLPNQWPSRWGSSSSFGFRFAAISLQLAKTFQGALTQNIGVALALFRKIDDSFCDEFVSLIRPVGKYKGYASHFECDAHDARGLAIKLRSVQK